MPEIYIPTNAKQISQRKQEEWEKYCKIIQWGRQNPVRFANEIFGLKLMDYQAWVFMNTWHRPFVCWLECRGAGKDAAAAVYFMTKLLLIPNYKVFVSTLSAAQSAESFKKLEDIAKQKIPSFKSANDVFLHELTLPQNRNTDGFSHNPAGHSFELFNGSGLVTLSSNIETLRGKRGSVWFNETGWMSADAMAVIENFINVDSNFSTSTEKVRHIDPKQMPLQLLYTSSASDMSFPFYEKYKTFAINMIKGDSNYFCCDIDAYDILNHSTIDGEPIKSHLSEQQIQKAIEEDADAADRELFNKFRKGSGANAVVSMDCIIRNSFVRKPELYNITGKDKYIICFDPARNFDGSVLTIFKVCDGDDGYRLECVNVISMVDKDTKKKTPLPMNQQIEIIKDVMIRYNGERSAEWENIEMYIDSGSGGGGISAVCDQLLSGWTDKYGKEHRGIIDPNHKQYETARKRYPDAAPIVTLVDPQSYKRIIYNALEKYMSLNLITFTKYDNKEYLSIEDSKTHEFRQERLSPDEQMALLQIELAKNEMSYMCRFDNPNGSVSYELSRDKKNTMHDDRAYTLALGAYALAKMRRNDILEKPKQDKHQCVFEFRQPKLLHDR